MSILDIQADQYKVPFTSFITGLTVNAMGYAGTYQRRTQVITRRDEYETRIWFVFGALAEKPSVDQITRALQLIDEFRDRQITIEPYGHMAPTASNSKDAHTNYLITVHATNRNQFLSDPVDVDISITTIFPWVY